MPCQNPKEILESGPKQYAWTRKNNFKSFEEGVSQYQQKGCTQ
jgi:hypothetical protein